MFFAAPEMPPCQLRDLAGALGNRSTGVTRIIGPKRGSCWRVPLDLSVQLLMHHARQVRQGKGFWQKHRMRDQHFLFRKCIFGIA
jgi:hypothetical protein